MKVRCLRGCNGLGYEKFKAGEIRDLNDEIGEKIVAFGYAEKIKPKKESGKKEDDQKASDE